MLLVDFSPRRELEALLLGLASGGWGQCSSVAGVSRGVSRGLVVAAALQSEPFYAATDLRGEGLDALARYLFQETPPNPHPKAQRVLWARFGSHEGSGSNSRLKGAILSRLRHIGVEPFLE